MIVVCSGCSAKFKVADEKVGPRGARLRCSRCGAVFTVRREEPAPEAEPAPPAVPPPLPRRAAATPPASPDLGAPVDARSAFEIDLEPAPAPARPAPEFDPFAPSPTDDPFAPRPAAPPPGDLPPAAPADPFGAGIPGEDPFAAVQAPVPPDLLRPAAAPAEAGPADDPFAAALPPLAAVDPGGDLALEERTTPPPRPAGPQSSAPVDDPFGAADGFGEPGLDGGSPGDIPPMSHDLPGEPFGGFAAGGPSLEDPRAPAPAPAARREAPLRVDPFAAAAVDADPLQVVPPAARGGSAGAHVVPEADADADAAAASAAEPAGARVLARLRGAAVNAISLLALLVAAAAFLLVWRGDVPLAEALHPSRLLRALSHGDHAPPAFQALGVSSGLYERARGAPLLFVRGEVRSNAKGPVAAVRVAVELVKDGAVVGRGEARAGGLPSPEELHGAADPAALAKVVEAAAGRAPAPVAPGQALPFLVALLDYPADLTGVALRVRAEGEAAR